MPPSGPKDDLPHEEMGDPDVVDADVVDIDTYEEDDGSDSPPKPVRAKAAPTSRPGTPPATGEKKTINKLTFVLTVLLAIAVVIIVRQAGLGPSANDNPTLPANHPDISQMDMGQMATLDEEKVAELNQKIEDNPQDVDTLKELGKTYVDARQYQNALDALNKAIEVAPDDMESHLMAGVCKYSLNNFEGAKESWMKATELDPTKAEPWFNLGFVYLMEEPVDEAELTRVWDKVLELAPDSDMAADIMKYRESAETNGD